MKQILTTLLITTSLFSYTQSKDVLAKAAFMKAQNAYGSGEYSEAITKLDEVLEMLSTTNPRIEYLYTQCYYETGDTDKAQKSLETYFDLAGDGDANYGSMLEMIDLIKERKLDVINEKNRVKAEKENHKKLWESALLTNTADSYLNYLNIYPKGSFHIEARSNLKEFQPPLLIDPRDGLK